MSLRFLKGELDRIREAGRHRTLRRFDAAPDPATRLDGKDALLFCSNNYLGLSTHPEVVQAAQEATARWGTGSGGSRLVSGNMALHRELEAALARLKGTEDALVYGTGYQANLGAVSALVGRGDLVVSDALNHASLIDACRLSRADVEVFAHSDAADAQSRLRAKRSQNRRALLLTDGIFSMDGDEAPLAALAQASEQNDAILMVDDAHGTGVLGGGAGTAHEHKMADCVDVQMGTLSKALASQGGFIAGSAELIDYLRNVSRPFIFSTAPSPSSMAAALAALRIVEREPSRIARLLDNARTLRTCLAGLGLQVLQGRTPIIPVVVGAEAQAMAFMRALDQAGVYVAAIRPPTVAPGTCRLRVTVMATHTRAHISACVDAFETAMRKVEVTAFPASS